MKLFSDRSQNNSLPSSDREDLLTLQSEIKALQLDLHDREKKIELLSQELERARLNQKDLLKENGTAVLEDLYTNLAPVIVQLVTQNYLVNQKNKAIQSRDILLITDRLIRALEMNGLMLQGQPGQSVHFDPNLHIPLSTASSFQAGQTVIVRFVGISYQGKIIRKAGVEMLEGEE
jgi:molecular chaperone GrpE (heat shock protein)